MRNPKVTAHRHVEALLLQGMTKAAIARDLKTSRQQIDKIINETAAPSIELVARLSRLWEQTCSQRLSDLVVCCDPERDSDNTESIRVLLDAALPAVQENLLKFMKVAKADMQQRIEEKAIKDLKEQGLLEEGPGMSFAKRDEQGSDT